MASHPQLDAPCPASSRCAVVVLLGFMLTLPMGNAEPQSVEATSSNASRIQQLFHDERWQEIADLHPALNISADIDFQYGIALARLRRWQEARAAFESGLRLSPSDSRFMVELAGLAFKQAQYAEAQLWLQRALQFGHADTYDLNFLATVFYLEGNLEAALVYWNQIGKPHISSASSEPVPKLNQVLLDRAFAFSPASTLKLSDLRTSEARIRQLDVFSNFVLDLEMRGNDAWDLTFRNNERNGCVGNSWKCLVLVFGGTPAQTLSFSYFNINRRAVNFVSSFRWDAQKRRIHALIELPLLGSPKWEFQAATDLRNENWAIRNSFQGPAPVLAALNLKREEVALRFSDVMSGNWRWFTSTEISNRNYRDILPGAVLTTRLLIAGAQLKQSIGIEGSILRWPERRLNVTGSTTVSAAKLWAASSPGFSQLQGMARLHWFPQHSGEKYEIQEQVRAGRTFGDLPFDELFVLGVLGDTDLYMRAHIATRGGKKGSAPMGRNYFVSNFEALRGFSPISILRIKVGPFLDTGSISDPIPTLGSHKWLWDVGPEAKFQAFGFGLTVSYARDLRSGKNAYVINPP